MSTSSRASVSQQIWQKNQGVTTSAVAYSQDVASQENPLTHIVDRYVKYSRLICEMWLLIACTNDDC